MGSFKLEDNISNSRISGPWIIEILKHWSFYHSKIACIDKHLHQLIPQVLCV